MINLQEQIPGTYPDRLTRAGEYLANLLEENDEPVLTQFKFFRLIRKMYAEGKGKKLYLRHDDPTVDDYNRLRLTLKKAGVIGADRDYGTRAIRILSVSDKPAENIICLIDPTCYISHLSAMQRWGLTDRNPDSLILTRPNRNRALEAIKQIMDSELADEETTPFPIRLVNHPNKVRRRRVTMYEAKSAGASIIDRSDGIRLSTIGQTFLDMLQKPEYCGGMAHILDVWTEHAKTHVQEIIEAVDGATSNLVKSRAGYILEEKLSIKHAGIEPWKAFGQRGSSRKLDPSKEFASTFSETWMISLNV